MEFGVTQGGPSGTGNGPILVLLVDDQAGEGGQIGGALRRAFEYVQDIELIGELRSGDGLAAAVQQYTPDVVLMDYIIPGTDTVEALAELVEAFPGVAVVIFSGMLGTVDRQLLMEVGAVAWVSKYAPTADLMNAIRTAAGRPPQVGGRSPAVQQPRSSPRPGRSAQPGIRAEGPAGQAECSRCPGEAGEERER